MKLWLDDRRPAPEGWLWARNVTEAQHAFAEHEIEECSLDHDLGLDVAMDQGIDLDDMEAVMDFIDSVEDVPEETGMDLVDWMIETGHIPAKITIHSWNIVCARRMARRFNDNGHNVTVEPFKEVN